MGAQTVSQVSGVCLHTEMVSAVRHPAFFGSGGLSAGNRVAVETQRTISERTQAQRVSQINVSHGKSHSAFVRKNLVVISSPSGSTFASMLFIESFVPSTCG